MSDTSTAAADLFGRVEFQQYPHDPADPRKPRSNLLDCIYIASEDQDAAYEQTVLALADHVSPPTAETLLPVDDPAYVALLPAVDRVTAWELEPGRTKEEVSAALRAV